MKQRALRVFFVFSVALTGLVGCDPDATYTVVYIVRHAEVDYSTGDQNPPLTGAGQARAQALATKLDDAELTAIYQTEKTRTRQTAAPVATDQGLVATELPDGQNQTLVNHVLGNHAGEAVLIVNHSHNILEIISGFGADRPFDPYPPDEYDKFILLIHNELEGSSSAGAFVSEYGAASP